MFTENPILYYDNLWLYSHPVLFDEKLLLNTNTISPDNIPTSYKKTKKYSRLKNLKIISIFFNS